MSDAQRLLRLAQKRDELRREADRAEGARLQLLARLKQEFGCDSLDGAEKLLAKMQKEKQRLEAQLTKKLDEMESKYARLLEGARGD